MERLGKEEFEDFGWEKEENEKEEPGDDEDEDDEDDEDAQETEEAEDAQEAQHTDSSGTPSNEAEETHEPVDQTKLPDLADLNLKNENGSEKSGFAEFAALGGFASFEWSNMANFGESNEKREENPTEPWIPCKDLSFNWNGFLEQVDNINVEQSKSLENEGDEDWNCEEGENESDTLKPVIDLPYQEVKTGHEHEVCLAEIPCSKLFVWGKDVMDQPCWKCRCSHSFIGFYEDKESKRIRIVARESATYKLRINQLVLSNVNLKKKTDVTWIWSAYDDSLQNFCIFLGKFADPLDAKKFGEQYIKCSGGSISQNVNEQS